VLKTPIVTEDTYCLEVVGKELRGEGEVNTQGEEEGRGTMVSATGDMYEGQWRAGKRHGHGKMTYATGDVYEGQYVEGKKHGHGKGTSAAGDQYDGQYAKGKKHGRGNYAWYATSYATITRYRQGWLGITRYTNSSISYYLGTPRATHTRVTSWRECSTAAASTPPPLAASSRVSAARSMISICHTSLSYYPPP